MNKDVSNGFDVKKYQPFNQVIYNDLIVLITSLDSTKGKYIIGNSSKTIDEVKLKPIPISSEVLKNCFPNPKPLETTDYYRWSFKCNKSEVTVSIKEEGYRCEIESNGEYLYDGTIKYLHELQNLVREHTKHILQCNSNEMHRKANLI